MFSAVNDYQNMWRTFKATEKNYRNDRYTIVV